MSAHTMSGALPWAIHFPATDKTFAAPSERDARAVALAVSLDAPTDPKAPDVPHALALVWPHSLDAWATNLLDHWPELSRLADDMMAVPEKWRPIWAEQRQRAQRALTRMTEAQFVSDVIGSGLTQTRLALDTIEAWQREAAEADRADAFRATRDAREGIAP
jgi:hypothetical protein